MFGKVLSLFALMLAMVMILCACSGNSSSANQKDPTKVPTIHSDPTDPTQEPDPSAPSKPESTDPELPSVEPEKKPYMTSAQALYGASPNGYGIWSVSYGLSTTKRLCVDSQGYVVFELDGKESDVAGVYNNAVLMKVNYDYYLLRSVPSGEILFDPSNADGSKIVLPEHNGKEMFRDGYIMAVRPTEDYPGVSYEIGFLNSDGLWIRPLSPGFSMLSYMSQDMTISQMEKNIVYLGEGILGLRCADDRYRYFNIETNTVTTAQFPINLSKHTLYDALDYNVYFIDGVSDPVYMNNNYYLFHADGRIEQFKVLWPKGLPRAEKCGNPYFDRKTKTAYFLYDYGDGILVADSEGKIIKKHEEIDVKEDNYLSANRTACRGFAEDGYARVVIKNSEDTACYAVLGIDGEFLFEPIELNKNTNTVFDPDGYHIDVESTAGSGYFVVIDYEGTVLHESDYVKDFSVKNHVIHFDDDGVQVYLDTKAAE